MAQHTWFITGINSGFGRTITELALGRGDTVAGTIRKPGSVGDLVERFGERLWVGQLDVTDTPNVTRVVDEAFAAVGPIDVIVNNAGYGLFGAVEELTVEQIDHEIATNLLGSIHVVRSALPHLREQSNGRIIQISTYGGQATNPGASLYHASKWGIEGFIESTAKDVAPFGIEATIVEPGGARTEFRFGSLQIAEPLAAYDISPSAMTRGAKDRTRLPIGDPAAMARLIMETVDVTPAPKRLVLGSDSYNAIHTALVERLADVESQKDVAFSTDIVE